MNHKYMIGNWLMNNRTHEAFQVSAYNIHQIHKFQGERFMNADKTLVIESIPLNEEWLIRCGFDIGFGVYNIEITEDCNMSVFLIDQVSNGDVSIGDEVHLYSRVFYVHQIQNLYFQLTGEELTIKP